MELGLYNLIYRPQEQLEKLFGGPGNTEMIVPLDVLTEARIRALDLPTRVSNIHGFHGEYQGEIEKELIVLNREVNTVVPSVDNLLQKPLETYRARGWPGLSLQSDDYSSLVRVAMDLGNLSVPPEETPFFRDEVFPNIYRKNS